MATRNQKKIEEINQILNIRNVVLRPYHEYIDIHIPEPGETLLENSLLKAEFVHRITKLPALGEDSGLFVEALNGAPGVLSARYEVNDKKRIERVLRELGNSKNRKAWFRAVIVYYYDIKKYEVFEGEIEGRIAYEPRGESGFGYDPIFIPFGYKETFAELGPVIKNKISHRAKALKKFKKFFIRNFVERQK
ncbi:MAG: RdgB/HAM1 family non-canonical purine NTP pyrophosphatase [candidate division WOR-3 bacterium]|nr:RdgB/HAM1 family non-canonical purine NTP pyrophosphatase [candidate division WOR-3 bacterium]